MKRYISHNISVVKPNTVPRPRATICAVNCVSASVSTLSLAAKRTLGCFSFGGGLKIIFSVGNGVFLRCLNLGDRRRISVDDCFWNLGDRRGDTESSSPFFLEAIRDITVDATQRDQNEKMK